MMNRRTRRLSQLSVLICLALPFALWQAAAELPSPSHSKPGQRQVTRSSAAAFVPSRGKLGQDLFLAVGPGNIQGVEALLKRGADPNARNSLEMTPLHIAAAAAPSRILELLLQAGGKLDATSPYSTPLMFACLTGNVPNIQLLLSRGASVTVQRPDGITPLMLACRDGLPDIVGELLRRKANPNAKDSDGATPLIYAAREGHADVGRILLDAGVPVDRADDHGWTPLMYAARNGNADFVKLLLDKGANPNARDEKKRTPLLLAATYGDHPDVIRALLAGGADVRATDVRHHSAYDLAVAKSHNECSGLLGSGSPAGAPLRSPRGAVQVSLKAIQRSMLAFNHNTGCVSCHQDGLGRIATGAAAAHGLTLNPAVERVELARVNAEINGLLPLHRKALKDPEAMKRVPLIEIGDLPIYYGLTLAGMAAHNQSPSDATAAAAMVVARLQLPDGHWMFALPRVPMESSHFTTTALAIQALRTYGPKANAPEIAQRIRHAVTWLLSTPAQTGEDRTFRLLALKWAGATAEQRRKSVDELRAEQRPDGGWPQIPTLQSDAYATGEALYALHVAGGLPITDPVYQRGVRFLLRTQEEDGSWFVNKRAMPANNYIDADFPHGQSQYSSFNGTCWATMALLQCVERPQRQASRTAN